MRASPSILDPPTCTLWKGSSLKLPSGAENTEIPNPCKIERTVQSNPVKSSWRPDLRPDPSAQAFVLANCIGFLPASNGTCPKMMLTSSECSGAQTKTSTVYRIFTRGWVAILGSTNRIRQMIIMLPDSGAANSDEEQHIAAISSLICLIFHYLHCPALFACSICITQQTHTLSELIGCFMLSQAGASKKQKPLQNWC